MTDSSNLDIKIRTLVQSYESRGYGVIEDFLTEQEVQSLRDESTRLIKEESVKEHKKHIFGNTFNSTSEYFMTSADKVRYFFEKNAFNSDGELILPEEQSLAKIGHALHALNPVFIELTTSPKVKQVFEAVGFEDPTVVQSMVIFKNPKVGGAYSPHQDASFLTTEPIHLAGIWLALDEATEENGCLQFIPGSHRLPLARRNVRVNSGDTLLEWTAPDVEYENDKFVRVPVKRGSMVLIHGLVVHKSDPNKSNKSRWIYTFHVYDKSKGVYLDDNWLQPTNTGTFISLK